MFFLASVTSYFFPGILPYFLLQCTSRLLLILSGIDSRRISYLHEESRYKSFAYIQIVVSAGEVCATPLQVESVHDACQLLSHVVRTLQ